MKRILAGFAISTVALLGLSACAGAPAPSAPAGTSQESAAPSTPSTPDTKPTTGSQQDACTAMSAPLQQVAQELAGIDMSQLATNPQLAVDVYNSVAAGFQDIVAQTSNPELKAAASAVLKDVETVRDGLTELVGGNTAGVSGLVSSVTSLQTSFQALVSLCQ